MKVMNAGLLIAVGLLVLFVAARGGFDCITGAMTCLKQKTGQ